MTTKPSLPSELLPPGDPSRAGVKPSTYPVVLDYLGYVGMHVGCLGIFWTGVTKTDLLLCLGSYAVRMFGLVAGYHRYFSHRAFKATRGMQFVLALLGTLSGQKGALWWAAHHRYHHRYSDTPLDVHSPVQRSFLYSHSGWFLDRKNRDTDYARVTDLAKFPELVWLNDWNVVVTVAYVAVLFAVFGWSGVVWGYLVSTVLLWHAVHGIGSFGHRFGGYRRFATPDNSRNKWFLAVVMLGEGWHNNHHYFPSSARQGYVWWEIDIAYYVLKLLSRFGLVWDLNLPPAGSEGKAHNAQKHLRKFKEWLPELRLSQERCIDAFAHEHGQLEQRHLLPIEEAKQKIQAHIDAFDEQATRQMLHDPEALRRTYAELCRNIGAEISVLAERIGYDRATAERLREVSRRECDIRASRAAFGHLFADSRATREFPGAIAEEGSVGARVAFPQH